MRADFPLHIRRFLRLAVVAALAAVQACRSAPSEGVEGEAAMDTRAVPAAEVENGILLDGASVRVEARVNARSSPMLIYARASSVDRTHGEPRPFRGLAVPPLELQFFRSPDRSGPPAWSSLRLPSNPCRSEDGDSPVDSATVIVCGFPGPTTLGDSLPPATYYFRTLLRLQHRTIVFSEGDAFLSPDSLSALSSADALRRSLRYDFDVGIDSLFPYWPNQAPWLKASLRVTNISQRSIRIAHGECAVQLRVHRGADNLETPVWNQWLPYGCPDLTVIRTIFPGEAYSPRYYPVHTSVPGILSDWLPNGRYYVDGIFRIGWVDEKWSEHYERIRLPGATLLLNRP